MIIGTIPLNGVVVRIVTKWLRNCAKAIQRLVLNLTSINGFREIGRKSCVTMWTNLIREIGSSCKTIEKKLDVRENILQNRLPCVMKSNATLPIQF